MLADRNAGAEQDGVRRAREVPRIVNVQRVDANKAYAAVSQRFAGLAGQKRVRLAIPFGAPAARPSGVKQHGFPANVAAPDRVGCDPARGVARNVNDGGIEMRQRLERIGRQVRPLAKTVNRGIHVGPGVSTDLQRRYVELGLFLVVLSGLLVGSQNLYGRLRQPRVGRHAIPNRVRDFDEARHREGHYRTLGRTMFIKAQRVVPLAKRAAAFVRRKTLG